MFVYLGLFVFFCCWGFLGVVGFFGGFCCCSCVGFGGGFGRDHSIVVH